MPFAWPMVPQERIELSASPLPRVRSTPELLRRSTRCAFSSGPDLCHLVGVRRRKLAWKSGANLPQAANSSKEFRGGNSRSDIADRGKIGHQIAMKSDKKRSSGSGAGSGGSDRQEREAAALRANLRRRKQQQQARQMKDREKERPEGENG